MSEIQNITEVQIGDLRIVYERAGKGRPLVLIHGWLSDHEAWRPQLDALSDEFTVVAWDAPGCGRSSDPPESFRTPEYADCLAAFIEALGLAGPHVLGLSFGSMVALELFHRHPAVPKTLVLASAYAGWAGSLPAEMVAQRLEQALKQSELPPDQWARGFVLSALAESAREELIDEVTAMVSKFHPAGYRVMAHAGAESDLRYILPRIDVPTLLLYGDIDRRSPKRVAEEMHAKIPASKLAFIRGAGHLSNVEEPAGFNAEVRGFLRSTEN